MTDAAAIIVLRPRDEAARLWRVANVALERAGERFEWLCEALDLGARAVEIVTIDRLQPVRARFPATIGSQLELPEPEVDVLRDAMAHPNALQLIDVIDLLSEDGESCVSPQLHRGWEDRRASCSRSRELARSACGTSIEPPAREQLLLLEAYRKRIFRFPPPVRIVPAEIRQAYPALTRLYDALTART